MHPAPHFDELVQLSQGFGALPPKDGGGSDEWPCFAGNPDCASIASGGVVIGEPHFTWSLAACDANSASSTNCGQIFWFYEDDTNDTTDDLIVTIRAKQGTEYVLDTGAMNLGPNPYGATPATLVVMTDDTAFGTLGQSGKGNGYCQDSHYTCVDPVAGIVTITVTTQVGPSKIMGTFDVGLE